MMIVYLFNAAVLLDPGIRGSLRWKSRCYLDQRSETPNLDFEARVSANDPICSLYHALSLPLSDPTVYRPLTTSSAIGEAVHSLP